MLYLTKYRWTPENRDAVTARFMETGGAMPAGVKLLGRWMAVGNGEGFALTESDDPIAAAAGCRAWADLMSFEVIPVLTDEQVAKLLSL